MFLYRYNHDTITRGGESSKESLVFGVVASVLTLPEHLIVNSDHLLRTPC